MIILGLGGILRDAACAVLKDGELLAAVEEAEGGAAGITPAFCRKRPSRPRFRWLSCAARRM